MWRQLLTPDKSGSGGESLPSPPEVLPVHSSSAADSKEEDAGGGEEQEESARQQDRRGGATGTTGEKKESEVDVESSSILLPEEEEEETRREETSVEKEASAVQQALEGLGLGQDGKPCAEQQHEGVESKLRSRAGAREHCNGNIVHGNPWFSVFYASGPEDPKYVFV